MSRIRSTGRPSKATDLQEEPWSDNGEAMIPTAPENTSSWSILWKAALCVMLGVIFGVAMEKGRVFEPAIIRQQMIFKKLIMLKMFLAAMATGMFGLGIVSMLPISAGRFYYACNDYFNGLHDKGIMSSVVGGTLLGVGMTLSGTCPTSLFAQLGAAVPNSDYALAGALLGTLAYGILKPVLDRFLKPSSEESTNPWVNSPFFIMALPLAAMFGVLVLSFEMLKGWHKDIRIPNPDAGLMEIKAWPPYVAGIIIGSLQVPLVIAIGESLGGSSSLLVVWAQVLIGPFKRISPFIAKYKWGFDKWWQIFFVGGVVLGAYWSASASYTLGIAKGVKAIHSFLGGFLVFFGARIAGGCTSGHGLSGMAFLSILSFITVVTMFAGAMATGFIMNSWYHSLAV